MSCITWRQPHRKRLFYSYLNDWALVILMLLVFFGLDRIPPYHREFSVTDKSIMFSYTEHEEVPFWALCTICFVAPFLIISAVSLGVKRSGHDFHSGALGLILAISLTVMFTQAIKITVGRPRPDFLARCQPTSSNVTDPPLKLSNYSICTTPMDSAMMIDAFKSFPSGHASFSFASLGYLALYLAGKLRIFDERGHTYKGFTFVFPVIGALLVAITRTRDYRHHWTDVTIGAILGAGCAFFAYRQYHPALGHANCHLPFAPRFLPPVAACQTGDMPYTTTTNATNDDHDHGKNGLPGNDGTVVIEENDAYLFTNGTMTRHQDTATTVIRNDGTKKLDASDSV